jgi:hypothetical protein
VNVSKRRERAHEVASDAPGVVIVVEVAYCDGKIRRTAPQYELNVFEVEQRAGVETRTFSLRRGASADQDVALQSATRFNANTLAKLVAAVRTPGTREHGIAAKAFGAFLTASGRKAPAPPFGAEVTS